MNKIWNKSLEKQDNIEDMKAMIFAAGLGTRLKPLTDSMPKAMVPVGGKPLLQHVIERLKLYGFDEILINVHHFANQVIDFVESNNCFDIRIEFSDESDKLLDTGGAVKKASWFFDDNKPFLIHNVDILSNIDLKRLYDTHLQRGADASVVVSRRDTFRYLLFEDNNRLVGWVNEKTGEVKPQSKQFDDSRYNKYAFSGIQVLSPSLFDSFEEFPDRFSIIDFYLNVCNKKEVIGYIPDNFSMIDVGKIDTLDEVERYLLNSTT